MILKNYIFSYVSGNYQQYTSDHSEAFLKPCCIDCKDTHQIAIHRDGNLMYYTYLYKKNASSIYGLSVVCGEVCLNLKWLYEYLQKMLESSANKGVLFNYDKQGQIRKNVVSFATEAAEIDNVFRDIKNDLERYPLYWEQLPPEDLSVPLTGKISLAFNDDDKAKITEALKHYHNVVVTMENTSPSSFSQTVLRLNSEKEQLLVQKNGLEREIEVLKRQKKQYKWVGILGIVVLILGVIIWNKVLFPSEVTHYETGEFVYYGPMKNKKPHGVGVAIYPTDDSDGRKYYIGNFVEGERQDSLAILFYQDGDYFYGNMEGDKWKNGLFYRQSDGTYFTGTFDNENNPYDGEWYDHVIKHHSIKGEPVYGVK